MTDSILKTRNVFVDTQAYCQQRFRFDHPTLKRLKGLCASKMLQLIVTETVVGEVKGKISDQIVSATNALSQFHNNASILESGIPDKFAALFTKPDQTELMAAGCNVWDKFLTDTKATIIPADVVDAKKLLGMYFNSEAPFDNGKKKCEFPDAISTLSLEHWATENNQQIYVISGDPDFERWCTTHPFATRLKSLGDFIDLYNRAEEKLTTLAHALVEKEETWIRDVIKDTFLKCEFYCDEDDVEDVNVNSVQIDGVNVIEVDEEHAIIALDIEIRFSAEIHYHDYYFERWDIIKKTFDEHFDVSLELWFSLETEVVDEIGEVLIDDGQVINLRRIDDGYPYK